MKIAIIGAGNVGKALAGRFAKAGHQIVFGVNFIHTEMNLPVINDPEANKLFLTKLPVGRWGKVEEIGGLACYLCSDLAGFITGIDILIDGGWTAA